MPAQRKEMVETAAQSIIAEPRTLTEKSASLARDSGFSAVFVFAAASISLASAGVIPFSTLAGLFPGSSLIGMLAVTVMAGLVLIYLYAVIGALVPRFGADYILTGRVISAPLAFASSWVGVILFGWLAGSAIASIFQETFLVFLRTLMIVMRDQSAMDVLSWVRSPYGTVLLGTFGVVLIFMLLMLPPQVTRRVLWVGLLLSLVAWVTLIVHMVAATPDRFPAAWDGTMGDGSYLQHLYSARERGMQSDYSPRTMLLAGLLVGYWVFYGYLNPTSLAGEVKQPGKNLLLGSGSALLLCFSVISLAVLLLQRLVPGEWLSAESYLYQATGSTSGAMPWITFYVIILQPSRTLVILLALTWVFGILNMAHAFLYAGSRVILAWTDDRLLPRWVGFVHPVLKSPLIAVLFVSLVAEIGVVESALNGSLPIRFNPLFFMVLIQVLPILGVTLLPYLKRDWYQTAPRLVRIKVGPVPLVSFSGVAALFYLLWMIMGNSLQGIFGGISLPTVTLFGALFLFGLSWFFARHYYLKQAGEDIDLLLQRLPLD